MNADQSKQFRSALTKSEGDYGIALSDDTLDQLVAYYKLLCSWNTRLHLVAPTSPQEFASRHVLESLLLLEHLPLNAVVADIGSGGGLPIIPNLIARPDVQAVLIESAKKKAVFLREALVETGRSGRATVIAERFEKIEPPNAGFITSRALEEFESMVPELVNWAPKGAKFLFFGGPGLGKALAKSGLGLTAFQIPNSRQRYLYVTR